MGILGSAFGRALAGAGGAAKQISSRYIDEELAQQRAQAIADIQRNNASAMRGDQLKFDTDPTNVAARAGAARTTALEAGKTARQVERERLSDPALNTATREKASADAAAARQVQLEGYNDKPLIEAARKKAAEDKAAERKANNDATIADANNPELLAAGAKIALANPEVAARIASARAAANSANSSAALHGVQAQAAKMTINEKKKIDGLYDDMGKILSDPAIDDAERAKRLADVERQIMLMKAKSAPRAARDPELDTETVTEERMNPDGTTTKVVRKEVRRPGAGGQAGPADDPIKAAMDAARAARDGGGKGGSAEPTRKDPLTGRDLTEREWDRKFGRGDFKKLYKPGEDSLKSF